MNLLGPVGGQTLLPVIQSENGSGRRWGAQGGNWILAEVAVVRGRLLLPEAEVLAGTALDFLENDQKGIELRTCKTLADPFGKMQN